MRRGTLVGATATYYVNKQSHFERDGSRINEELDKDGEARCMWNHLERWLDSKEIAVGFKDYVCEPVMYLGLDTNGFRGAVDIGRNYPDENVWHGAIDMWDRKRTIWDFKCAKRIRPEYWTQQLCLASMLPGDGPVLAHLVQVTTEGVSVHARDISDKEILTARTQMRAVLQAREDDAEGGLFKTPGKHCKKCPHRSLCDVAEA